MNVVFDLGNVVISAEHGVLKPEPEIFEILCMRNQLEPQDCVFIDDSASNVEGATAFGMDAIRFSTPERLSLRGLL